MMVFLSGPMYTFPVPTEHKVESEMGKFLRDFVNNAGLFAVALKWL